MAPPDTRQQSPIVHYFSNWYSNASQDLGLRLGIRLSQFALAITILVLYSRDVKTFIQSHTPIPASWIYAQVVSSLSIIVCLWCTFINAKHRISRLLLDFVLAVLWAAQAGYFGMIYWRDDNLEDRPPLANEKHMQGAVGVGLACMVLWLVSCFQSIIWRCQALRRRLAARKARKQQLDDMRVAVLQDEEKGIVAGGQEQGPLAQKRSREEQAQSSPNEVLLPISDPSEECWADEKRRQAEFIARLDMDALAREARSQETIANPPPAYRK